MSTRIDEIASGIYRISTFADGMPLPFNQYLVAADEPLLFHTGMASLFPVVRDAVATVIAPESLRWITFGHIEADESGSMNEWLSIAPRAQVAHSALGCMVQVNELALRPPHPLEDGDVLDLGSHRVRYLATPHVPHGWDAGVVFEETTGTLMSGDLFTRYGPSDVLVETDIVEEALAAEEMGQPTALTPSTAPTIRRLADLKPTTLALMHGPAYRGDASKQLDALADGYAERFAIAVGTQPGS
jgi:flavorubredoxin